MFTHLFHPTSCSTDVNIYPPHAQGGACFQFVDAPLSYERFHMLVGDMKDRMYLDPLHWQGGKNPKRIIYVWTSFPQNGLE